MSRSSSAHQAVSIDERARLHAALGEPTRLAIVDDLMTSDRSPVELGERLGVRSNLLARHLDVLASVGLLQRSPSHADGRRKYVRLDLNRLSLVQPLVVAVPQRVVFVCTQNAARSPLAAAIWRKATGRPATSAGLRPVAEVHAGTRAAARRARVDLGDATPRHLDALSSLDARTQVITVCDQVHEELAVPASWWHWSLPDPAAFNTARAFDAVVAQLVERITPFALRSSPPHHEGASPP